MNNPSRKIPFDCKVNHKKKGGIFQPLFSYDNDYHISNEKIFSIGLQRFCSLQRNEKKLEKRKQLFLKKETP